MAGICNEDAFCFICHDTLKLSDVFLPYEQTRRLSYDRHAASVVCVCLGILPLEIVMSLTILLHRGTNIRVYIKARYFN